MKQHPEPNRRKKLPIDYMPNISNVASDTECTGIVPVSYTHLAVTMARV